MRNFFFNIKNKVFRLTNNDFVSSSFYAAISAFVKISVSFVLGKVIAVKLGSSGMGLFGQLSSFVAIALVLSGGTINYGVTKYVSEYRQKNPEYIKIIISSAFRIVVISSLMVGLLLIIFSAAISEFVLFTPKYKLVFTVFGLTILFYGLNNLFLAIVNGFKEFRKFNQLSIIGSVAGLLLSLALIYQYNTFGALMGLVLNQSIIFLVTLFYLKKEKWVRFKIFFERERNKNISLQLLKYGALAIVSAALIPLSQLIIRNYVIQTLGVQFGGYWELVLRISASFLMFFSLSIATYYLPRISELNSDRQIRYEIFNTYKIIIPVSTLLLILLYILRFEFIKFLSTEDFYVAEGLFLFQLVGDFFKILAWVLGFQMLARAKIRLSIFTEVFYNILFILLSLLFINEFGFVGLSYAYALNYFIYFLVLVIIFRNLLFKVDKKI